MSVNKRQAYTKKKHMEQNMITCPTKLITSNN